MYNKKSGCKSRDMADVVVRHIRINNLTLPQSKSPIALQIIKYDFF